MAISSQPQKPLPNTVLRPGKVNVMGVTPHVLARWMPSLAIWGLSAAVGVVLFASRIPKFKTDVFAKIPILDEIYKDKTPDSDKPF